VEKVWKTSQSTDRKVLMRLCFMTKIPKDLEEKLINACQI
jgi:hypothetical protein